MSGHPCPERLLLPEALSGRLDPAEEKRVMAHVQSCATCQDAATDIEISLISLAVLRDEAAAPLRPAGAAGAADADADRGDSASRPGSPGGLATAWPPPGHSPAPTAVAAMDAPAPGGAAVLPWRRRLSAYVAAAAAAAVLVTGGVFVGHSVLPPRDRPEFGPAVALSPPPGAADTEARGSVAIATGKDSLAVRLNATSLPTSGWYECIWVAGGQSRSAGSFRAPNGVAKDVQLRVAQPQGSTDWDLQLVHHQGDTTEVVLEGDVQYS